MKNEAWEKFQRTGRISDYLAYKQKAENRTDTCMTSRVQGGMTAKYETQGMGKDERKTDTHRDGASGSTGGRF